MTTTKQRKDSFSFSILFIILFSTRELGKEQFTFDPVSIQNNYLNMINISWLKKIIWVIGVLRRTVVIDWRCDNLCGSHLQSQVVVLVSWKFKNPGERFETSVNNNSPSQDSNHPDDLFQSRYVTPGFKPFSYDKYTWNAINSSKELFKILKKENGNHLDWYMACWH